MSQAEEEKEELDSETTIEDALGGIKNLPAKQAKERRAKERLAAQKRDRYDEEEEEEEEGEEAEEDGQSKSYSADIDALEQKIREETRKLKIILEEKIMRKKRKLMDAMDELIKAKKTLAKVVAEENAD